ncbi:biliverdin-producing heme oxygenase [Croceivirga radicis]|uniref:biliverdin-producing heme oxygenase n=1 Tax=Croceivirga radicis TaxID=1929488 RepID=UPI000255B28E|nr:biliverdin-producing heme oxygenase [Croceivirga radicis]
MSILTNLKNDTKAAHVRVEKVMVKELKAINSLEDYGKLLERLFLFYNPLESKVHQYIDQSILPDIERRKHTQWILKDLNALNYTVNTSTESKTQQITSTAYAVGVLYVMEGSTMGGQIISKMLKKQLGANTSTYYFDSYSDETMDMWLSFKNSIAQYETHLDKEEVFKGANETFSSLKEWLELTSILENISE